MINWFNMPSEGLSNGGQFEIKELTATENKVYEKDGEVYSKVTVNVEGGGGGGSSDFSTAEVTIVLNNSSTGIGTPDIRLPIALNDENPCMLTVALEGENIVPLYKGAAIGVVIGTMVPPVTVNSLNATGDIEVDGFDFYVTGNGTLTINYTSLGGN